ncbi:MAG: 50S ribosomal protein L32, partial [Thermoanaerobaculia bacterium]
RTHDALRRTGTSLCDNCGEVKLPHRVCASCGHYRGREVIEVEEL